MEVASKWNVDRQELLKTKKDVSVTLFSGKLRDISFDGFPVGDAKRRLMRFLRDSTWSKFLARYEGKYPVNEYQAKDFLNGDLEFGWPLSDIVKDEWFSDEDQSGSAEDESETDEESEDEEDTNDGGGGTFRHIRSLIAADEDEALLARESASYYEV
jgi:hypothetical protein